MTRVDDPTLTVLALLGLAALTAGFVDAIVGGGGLIQLPAVLLGLPGASPVEVLATNKLASAMGTTVAAGTYYRRIKPDPRTFLPLMALSFVGSALGAAVAFLIPKDDLRPDRAGGAGRRRRLRAVPAGDGRARRRCASPDTGTPRPRC